MGVQATRKKWRRRLVIAAAVLVALVAAVKTGVYFFDWRPIIERAVEKELGLRFDIGALYPSAIPWARLEGRDVVLGEDDFEARADRVVAKGSLWRLALRHVLVTQGEVDGLVVHFPETFEGIADRWRAVEDHQRGRKKKPDTSAVASSPAPSSDNQPDKKKDDDWTVHIVHIDAPDVVAYMGAREALRGRIEIHDLVTDRTEYALDADIPRFGRDARVVIRATLTESGADDPHLDGKALLWDWAIWDMGLPSWLPEAWVDAELRAQGVFISDIGFDVQGDLRVPDTPGLGGAFAASAWLQQERVIVNQCVLEGPGLRVTGDFTREPDGRMACRIEHLDAFGAGLTDLMALASTTQGALEARGDGHLTVTGLLLGTDDAGGLRLVEGAATLSGIDFTSPDGALAFDDLQGSVSVVEGAFRIDELRSAGMTARGWVRPVAETGAIAVDLAGEMDLQRERLAAWLPLDTVEELSGRVAVDELKGTFGAGAGLPPDLRTQFKFEDVCAVVRLADFPESLHGENLNGTVSFADGVLKLNGIRGRGIALDGTVRIGLENGGAAMDLRGDIDLASGIAGALLPRTWLRDTAGTARFSRVAGTFAPGQGLPADLQVEGELQGAQASLAFEGYTDTLSEVNAIFSTTADHLIGKVSGAVSERLGSLEADLSYGQDDHIIHGMVTVDLARLPALFVSDADARKRLETLLAAYGRSTLDINVALPTGEGAWSIEATRRGEPALHVRLASGTGATTGPDAFECRAQVPLEAVASLLPPSITPAGVATVHAAKRPGENDFTVEIQLDQAEIALGRYLRKRAGDPASVAVRGVTGVPGWEVREARVDCLGESIVLSFGARGDARTEFDLNLEPLARLLPEGGSSTGRVAGAVATEPLTLHLALSDAGLGIRPDAAIDSMNGEVDFQDGYLTCREVRVRGADSDCTVNANYEGDHWEAQITGEKLDLDAFAALLDAVQSFRTRAEAATEGDSRPAAVSAPASAPAPVPERAIQTGEVSLQLKSLYYRRGRLDDIHTDILIHPDEILFDNLNARPYSGIVDGKVRIALGTSPRRLALSLSLNDADMKILDDIFFEPARQLAGTATGFIDLEFPLAEATDVLRDMSGRIDLDISNGSYGELGAVTQALSFFRVLEFIRLSAPALDRKGLAFDKSLLKLVADKGLITLDTFTLTSKSYAIDGFGTLNYRDDVADVIVRVNLLELVTGIVTRVPVLGSAVDRISSYADLVVHVGGSPLAPEFSLRPSVGSRKPKAEEGAEEAPVEGVVESVGL